MIASLCEQDCLGSGVLWFLQEYTLGGGGYLFIPREK
jgi:hypothetical protein